MATTQCKQFLIGLPAAGKTTFLAALWHVINSDEVDGALELEQLTGDQEHLNGIRDIWSDVKSLERTKVGAEKFVSMLLRCPVGKSVTEVTFPDLSGESFTLQWVHRKMKNDHATLVQKAVGGLLLIHPEYVIPETLIPDVMDIVDDIKSQTEAGQKATIETNQTGETGINESPDQTEWDPKKAPTQIQLVDLLQFVAVLNARRPIRLAVVVSAWDCIGGETSPRDWIRERLPLLWQYLNTNSETFSPEFYGISAQGGGLEEADELRRKIRPSDRIRVVKHDLSESHDITTPIRWIME